MRAFWSRLFIVLGVLDYAGGCIATVINAFVKLDGPLHPNQLMVLGLAHLAVGLLLERKSGK
jgi:hypothetical protein